MQIKYMKGLSLLLATVSCIILMGGFNVFADTQAMKVSAKRVSSYSVTIPSTLSLTTTDKQNFTGTYTVGVKGDVAANDTVYLRPQNTSFEMVGKADSNNKSTASVTQTKTEWSGGEIDNSSFTETTGDVEVEITHADEYEGDLVFDYGIEINLQPGLYDADNNLLLALTKEMVETNYWGNNYKSDNAVKVVFPDTVTSIGEHAFDGCIGLTSVTIPNSVTIIGDYAFYHCNSLASVIIPNSVITIGNQAFNDCNSLSSIIIPDSVTTIGGYAFYDCENLASVTIPDSVISIGYYAFMSCPNFTSINIPDSVTSIGEHAFDGCTNLASVTYKGETYTSKSALKSALTSNGVSMGYGICENTSLSE